MRYLNKITDQALQRFNLTGNPGERTIATLRYMPTQQNWVMDLQYNDFILNGITVTTSPNILRAYKNLIPFGICCNSTDGLDPYLIDDFAVQRCNLYLLDRADVLAIEAGLFT